MPSGRRKPEAGSRVSMIGHARMGEGHSHTRLHVVRAIDVDSLVKLCALTQGALASEPSTPSQLRLAGGVA